MQSYTVSSTPNHPQKARTVSGPAQRAGPPLTVAPSWCAAAQGGLTLTLDGRRMVDVIQDGPEEDRHLRTIAAHTSAYITHVRRQLRHTIPKAIVHCLVRCHPPPP